MGLVVLRSNVLAGEVSVHLGRGYAGVAKKLLDVPQRGAAPQQMGREAVSERMRRYLSGYAGLSRMAL